MEISAEAVGEKLKQSDINYRIAREVKMEIPDVISQSQLEA